MHIPITIVNSSESEQMERVFRDMWDGVEVLMAYAKQDPQMAQFVRDVEFGREHFESEYEDFMEKVEANKQIAAKISDATGRILGEACSIEGELEDWLS